MPAPADAAMPTRRDLHASPKLSILKNGPESFKGRKLGVLVSDGADVGLVTELKKAVEAEGGMIEFVAPKVSRVSASDGTWIEARQQIHGGPSVLYDAVAIVVPEEGGKMLASLPPAKDFVSDAFAHMKFIAYAPAAAPLLRKAGIGEDLDAGCVELDAPAAVKAFVAKLGDLRYWPREKELWVK